MKISLSQLGERTQEPPISWLLKVAIDKPDLISLAAGFTDSETLPVDETKQLADLVLSGENARKALQYGTTNGDYLLRKLTSERLIKMDNSEGESYSPENIVITNGSQQFLYLITEALCNPNDIVIVEAPTYFVFLGIIQSFGVTPKNVQMDEDGINPESLISLLDSLVRSGELPRVKFLYSITYFQNPTSRTTSFEKKRIILDILKKYEKKAGHAIFYIEDAAYRELRFCGQDVPSSLSISRGNSRVIYTGTYSKPYATGIRVGYSVLPKELSEIILRIKGNHDFGTSSFLQFIICEALRTKLYDTHIQTIIRRYSEKADVMEKAIKENFNFKYHCIKPQGGLYFWVALDNNRRTRTDFKSSIFRKSLDNNVLYVPGNICYANDLSFQIPRNEMRVSFGYASVQDIKEGIRRLGISIRNVLNK